MERSGSDGAATGGLVEDTLAKLWIGRDQAVCPAGNQDHPAFILKGVESEEGIKRRKGPCRNPMGHVMGWNRFAWQEVGLQQCARRLEPCVTPDVDGSTRGIETL